MVAGTTTVGSPADDDGARLGTGVVTVGTGDERLAPPMMLEVGHIVAMTAEMLGAVDGEAGAGAGAEAVVLLGAAVTVLLGAAVTVLLGAAVTVLLGAAVTVLLGAAVTEVVVATVLVGMEIMVREGRLVGLASVTVACGTGVRGDDTRLGATSVGGGVVVAEGSGVGTSVGLAVTTLIEGVAVGAGESHMGVTDGSSRRKIRLASRHDG